MLVGHWAVMGRARPRQVAFIKGFGFVALHIYWNWLVARLKGDQRRGEEKRGEGRKYRSGTISDLWKRLESKNRYAHSLRKSIHVKRERERDRQSVCIGKIQQKNINVLVLVLYRFRLFTLQGLGRPVWNLPCLKDSAQLQFPRLWLLEGSSDGFQLVWIYNLCIMVL